MTAAPPNDNAIERVPLWPWMHLVAFGYFALHLATSTRYGYFRDALYYLACSEHLDFGYVDQPPLIAVLAWIARHTFGDSLPALLFWPALAGAARVVLTAMFARELGARRFGVMLAAVLAATPGVWWVIDHQFAMNALEAPLWLGCAYSLLRLIKTQNPRWWLAFGVIAGVGLENKYSVVFFASALLAGLLLSSQRRLLFTPWLLVGGGAALLLFLPNLIWNVQHGWPFLELMHNISSTGKDVILSPGAYLAQQVLMMNPVSFPFWAGGLLFYLFARAARPYRVFGWAFVITVAFFLITHGKDYYSAPAYTLVLAAGGVAAEWMIERTGAASRPMLRAVLRPACFVWLLVGVVLLLPLVLPVLSVDAFLRYQSRLPFEVPRNEHSHEGAALPQYYADEFPWPGMVETVARVYHSLPPAERAQAAIFCDNYGQAAAVDFFGPRHGLPKAISGHQNYFLWGPRGHTGEVLILVGVGEADARRLFESVEVAATQQNPYALWYETQPILVGRGLKWDLQANWPRVKRWR